MRDRSGEEAASFSNQVPVDTSPPVLTTAFADRSGITLAYNEPLDGGSVPLSSAFRVVTGHRLDQLLRVEIRGSEVRLHSSVTVQHGDTVEVSYTKPSSNPIQDTSGNEAASFNLPSILNTVPDTLEPFVEGFGDIAGHNKLITVKFNELLDTDFVPPATDFSFTQGSERGPTTLRVVSVRIVGAELRLTLNENLQAGRIYYITYKPTINTVRDLAGNLTPINSTDGNAFYLNDAFVRIGDNIAPTLTLSFINGDQLLLSFDESIVATSIPATSDFTVTISGDLVRVTNVLVEGGPAVILTLATAAVSGQFVSVTYLPGDHTMQDSSGNEVASFFTFVENRTS